MVVKFFQIWAAVFGVVIAFITTLAAASWAIDLLFPH